MITIINILNQHILSNMILSYLLFIQNTFFYSQLVKCKINDYYRFWWDKQYYIFSRINLFRSNNFLINQQIITTMKYHSPIRSRNSKMNITFNYVTTPQHRNKQNCSPSNNMVEHVDQFTISRHRISLKDVKYKCTKCGKTVPDQDENKNQPLCTGCKQKDNPIDKFTFTKSPKNKPNPHTKNTINDFKIKNHSHKTKELELETFLQDVQKQYRATSDKLIEIQEKKSTLKQIFDDKRNYLKNHYDKIRIALEQAMLKDIKSLEESQNQELMIYQEEQTNLNKDLQKLEGIKQDIQPNIQKIIEKVQQHRYNEFLLKYKQQVSRIASLNISKVSSNLTITASIQDKQSFYDSSLFRIIQGAQQQKQSRSESFVMGTNSGIFFSFQKKKI